MQALADDENDVFTLNGYRQRALQKLNNAKFNWFHVKVGLVASAGFFTDAYDLFAISIASTMLGLVYRESVTGTGVGQLSNSQDLGIKASAQIGTLFGQLVFGWLADVLGRKRMYGIELTVIIIGTFGQAVAGSARSVNIFAVIIAWRFFTGVGIGGDYPLSAVISSEFSSTHIRGRLMTMVFAAQSWGNLAAGVVAIAIVAGYKSSLHDNDVLDLGKIDAMWRLLIGLGCVPACIALYFRLTIPESPRFTMDIERDIRRANAEVEAFLTARPSDVDSDEIVQRAIVTRASRRDFMQYFSQRENFKMLFACAWSWFALDIAFFGLGLNSTIVLRAIGVANLPLPCDETQSDCNRQVFDYLYALCRGNIILAIAGLIPGSYACFFFIDSWGRKPIQLMGFTVLTILFAIMGFANDKLRSTGPGTNFIVALYCFSNFFSNFGPNTTTFIIPGEAFPTRYRSTAHGISAASGKLGAIIATVGFAQLKDIGGTDNFVKHILEIFALFMATGILSTFYLTETKGKTLEDLSNEDQTSFVRGIADPIVLKDGNTTYVWTPQRSTQVIYERGLQEEHIPMRTASLYGGS